MTDSEALTQQHMPRNFQIPGCSVDITTGEEGIPVEELLSIAFSLAHSNPGAIVDVAIRIRAAED